MLRRRSNGLKTWRRSHVNRLRFARQRRVGLPGWPNYWSPDENPALLAPGFIGASDVAPTQQRRQGCLMGESMMGVETKIVALHYEPLFPPTAQGCK